MNLGKDVTLVIALGKLLTVNTAAFTPGDVALTFFVAFSKPLAGALLQMNMLHATAQLPNMRKGQNCVTGARSRGMTLQMCGEMCPHPHFRELNIDNGVRTSFAGNRHRPGVALSPGYWRMTMMNTMTKR